MVPPALIMAGLVQWQGLVGVAVGVVVFGGFAGLGVMTWSAQVAKRQADLAAVKRAIVERRVELARLVREALAPPLDVTLGDTRYVVESLHGSVVGP